MKNYYEVLGVTLEATPEDLKAAYHQQAKANHPDKKGPQATEADKEAFQEINTAYHVLSDKSQRTEYDLKLKLGGISVKNNPADEAKAQEARERRDAERYEALAQAAAQKRAEIEKKRQQRKDRVEHLKKIYEVLNAFEKAFDKFFRRRPEEYNYGQLLVNYFETNDPSWLAEILDLSDDVFSGREKFFLRDKALKKEKFIAVVIMDKLSNLYKSCESLIVTQPSRDRLVELLLQKGLPKDLASDFRFQFEWHDTHSNDVLTNHRANHILSTLLKSGPEMAFLLFDTIKEFAEQCSINSEKGKAAAPDPAPVATSTVSPQ